MKKRKRRYDAVVFDMDGTLTDSEPLHHLAYQRVVSSFSVTFTAEEYNQFTGATDKAIATYLIEKHSLPMKADELIALKEEVFVELAKTDSVLRPGVENALIQAQDLGLKLAVASSAMMLGIETVLDTLKIRQYFSVLASGEEVKRSKPKPDVYLLAARRLKVRPSRCIAFEDSRNGTLAAKAARMYCIVVPCPSTEGQDHSAADRRLTSFEELGSLEELL